MLVVISTRENKEKAETPIAKSDKITCVNLCICCTCAPKPKKKEKKKKTIATKYDDKAD